MFLVHRLLSGLCLLLLTGCEEVLPSSDPPVLTQLRCTRPGTLKPLVFVLDSGRRTVEWANGKGTPGGTLAISDHEYRLDFGKIDGVRASNAVVDRYDGRMELQMGPGPISTAVAPKALNARQTWTCRREAEGPKL
jgi:hypothetical protein